MLGLIQGRKGRVLHTYQSFFAFLHNRDYSENGGVFVTRARSLVSLAPKGGLMKLGLENEIDEGRPSSGYGSGYGSETPTSDLQRPYGLE